MLYAILILVCVVNAAFVYTFVRDLSAHKNEVMKEAGNPVVMAISQLLIYFFSAFGISDFAIGASLYPKAKWIDAKRLPGTLNTACVVPVAAMALAYISSVKIGIWTLIVPIIAQVLGAYLSPRFVVKLPARKIKYFVTAGLFVAAAVILLQKLSLFPSGGNAFNLTGWKLILLGILSFVYGAFNNLGIGSYPLSMATVCALGLDPIAAFPMMMGACTFSVPVGSMEFIKLNSYSRKITLFSATAGVLGVLIAVFLVKGLNTNLLQWIVLLVILYSAVSMLLSLQKKEA